MLNRSTHAFSVAVGLSVLLVPFHRFPELGGLWFLGSFGVVDCHGGSCMMEGCELMSLMEPSGFPAGLALDA